MIPMLRLVAGWPTLQAPAPRFAMRVQDGKAKRRRGEYHASEIFVVAEPIEAGAHH
jgi:hypothetical protein